MAVSVFGATDGLSTERIAQVRQAALFGEFTDPDLDLMAEASEARYRPPVTAFVAAGDGKVYRETETNGRPLPFDDAWFVATVTKMLRAFAIPEAK